MKTLLLLPALCLAACAPLSAQTSSAPSPEPPPVTVPAGCQPDTSPLSPADAAFYQEDWGRAAKLYHDEESAPSTSMQASAGTIRVLLEQEKTDDALELAQRLAAAHPNDALAQEILGEVYVRSGELGVAPDPLAASLRLNNCLGRTHYAEGRLLQLSGLMASAARQFAAAHALSPSDMQATVAWMRTLPPDVATPLILSFLDKNTYLNSERREDLRGEMTLAEAFASIHSTVSVPKFPAVVKLVPGPQHGPDPGIASMDVSFNGHARRLRFETDTMGIFITRALAEAMGLKPIVHWTGSLAYGSGRFHYYLAKVDTLRIGPVEYKDFPVTVMDEDFGFGRNMEGTEGFLGIGTLNDFLVHADYAHHQIRLDALPQIARNDVGHGLKLWSQIVPGTASPSMNGNAWGNLNRTVAPAMRDWSSFFGDNAIYLLTKFGSGPERLFILDMNALHPRISTTAQYDISKIRAAGIAVPGSSYGGYFMSFAGMIVPVDSWVALRFDNGSERRNLEISGIIDQSALLSVPFSVDYRDHLIQFEKPSRK